jgi:hypothetical protein
MTVLVSRFPDRITPGALPILPELVTIHSSRLGGCIVFRWFDDGGELQQMHPEFCCSIPAARELIPDGYELVDCPADFALEAYRPGGEQGEGGDRG